MNRQSLFLIILGALLVYLLPPLNTEKTPKEPPEEQYSPGAVESDMILSPDQLEERQEGEIAAAKEEKHRLVKRNARKDASYHWPGAIIPYLIDDNAADYEGTIKSAMEHWENQTCLRFKPYTNQLGESLGHHDYISLEKGDGCSSPVGRQRTGSQTISLGSSCNFLGTAAHEIGHSLGFYHEQTRPDRDQYVTIQTNNLKPKTHHNFVMYERTEGSDYQIPYDLGSIMHYGAKYYSKNGKLTIKTQDSRVQSVIGQREELSFFDIKLANLMYKCGDGCDLSKECSNHGYLGPGCQCVCPLGLTGDTCTEVKTLTAGCGGVLTASSGTITSPNYPQPYGQSQDCIWFIPGGPGRKVTLTFDKFSLEADSYCAYDWLEIRILGPQFRGPRFCGKKPPNFPIELRNEGLFLRFHSDDADSYPGFSASYKVETITMPVNGGWTTWGDWQKCSASCGYGIKKRTRKCSDPKPAYGGAGCEGRPLEFLKCSNGPC
ncbi:blastula protease 10-like isoform X2 [Lineus longissimus]